MSGKLRGTVKWDSSTDEDTSDAKYGMKLRESSRSTQQSSVAEETVVEPRRRGRGPSKRPCLNRNALMARENRQRKKAYLEKIENKLSFYQQENKSLMNTIRKQGIDIKRLTAEVAYLRSVLNNNTSIMALLKTINDGLRRFGAQKRNSALHQNDGAQLYPEDGEARNKCNCYSEVKENALNSQNMFVNTTNDRATEANGTQSQINGFYLGGRKHGNSKILNGKREVSPFSETDHTYTIAKNSIGAKNQLESRELENTVTTTTNSISQASEDSYTDDLNGFDGSVPITQFDMSQMEEKKDLDISTMDFDQLPSFNMDIFEDLPKCDDIMNTVDSLHDPSTLFSEEDMFQSLDNTGICLHVNSDKVSLEFCSICHLNSKNSGVN